MNTYTTKGPLIDGFAINCGNSDRVITLKDGIYTIGCFKGTKEEAIEAISNKYDGVARDAYLAKLDDAENMLWLIDEVHEQLMDDEYCIIRIVVAKYSDRYHEQLKNDEHWRVRLTVANYKKGKI